MWNNKYKKFSKNQFHYDSNGNMVDNQTGKSYTQSATNGQDVVIFGMPKMQIVNNNDATAVSKQPIVQSLNRGEVAARLNAERKQHRQQVGAAQDDAEQAKAYFDKSMREATQPTIYGKTANVIHNIANLGTGAAYMSGNPTAIAATSGYAIPSTLKRWFTEGMDSNEMLANVTPIGKTTFKLKYPLDDYLINSKDRNAQEYAAELLMDNKYKSLGKVKTKDFMQAVNDAKKTKEPIYGTFRPGDNKLNPLVEAYFTPEIGRVLRYDEIQPWLERKQLKYDEGYRKLHNAKLAAAKKETEVYSQAFENKYAKPLDELWNQGIKLSSMEWLADNGRMANKAIKASDYDIARYRSHIPEYIDLAKSLQKSGDLVQKEKHWYGKFGDQLKPVNPRDYIVSKSNAFKKAGLYWDGETFRSGMSNSQMYKLRRNGGIGAENWTNNNPLSTGRYGDLQPDLVTTPGEVKPLVRSAHPSANNWYGGGHMGDFVQPDKGTTVFENYWDDFSQQQINKTKVIPRNKKVKSLKGNNGDFNMDDPDIFAYINNNNNDKSSFWT